jgi:hypothetical protein
MIVISNKTLEIHVSQILEEPSCMDWPARILSNSISGLVVEYIVAIDVTRVRFPADAFDGNASTIQSRWRHFTVHRVLIVRSLI